jgi:hypothetical protein
MRLDNDGLAARKILLIIAIAIVVGGVGWLWYRTTQDSIRQVNSFGECAAAGYPIEESDPRRCRTPDGRSFPEENIAPEEDRQEPRTEEDEESETDQEQVVEYTSEGGDRVRMRQPHKDEVVTSPLTVKGEVKGTWAFEGEFRVELTDARREVITQTPARLRGDHMTEDFVPFETTLEYPQEGRGGQGYLILRKSNPSGEPERDDSLELPIRFSE